MLRQITLLWLVAALYAVECPPSTVSRAEAQARAANLIAQAQVRFQRGEVTQAAQQFEQAVCLDPAQPSAYVGWGISEAAAGHFEQALQALERACQLAPRDIAALLARAQVEASLGRFASAEKTISLARGIAPEHPRVSLMALRIALAQNQKPDIARLKQLLIGMGRQFPREQRVHAEAGRILLEHAPDLALAELLRARSLGPLDPESAVRLATLENLAGGFSDAIRETEDVLKNSVTPARLKASAAAIAGVSYEGNGQIKEAAEQLTAAIGLAPDVENGYLALAGLLEKQQNWAGAVAALERGIKAFPKSAALALALGSVLLKSGDTLRAEQALGRLTAKDPQNAEVHPLLAQAQFANGKAAEAAKTWGKLAGLQPDYPMLHSMIAQCLLAQTPPDHAGALAELARALVKSPEDPELYYLQGKVYSELGKYSEAERAFRRAIELQPSIAAWHYQLGQVYQKLGRAAAAKEEFERMTHLRPNAP